MSELAKVVYFPVRHHSPRASAALARLLAERPPLLVMVEGPRDAQAVVPHLFDADTVPPVAILGYATDGSTRSSLYPFASYSPEYVALRWAHENGVPSELIDLTTAEGLAYERDEPAASEEEVAEERDLPPSEDRELESDHELALRHGFRSFEELWEAWFEAPEFTPDDFSRALIAWAQLVRLRNREVFHRARDARMVRHISEAIARGVPPERICVVVGAAHAAAMVVGDIEPELERLLDKRIATQVTLIPYSFTRLAGQTGYGAGNRAPRYYQKAHDAGCDYTRATLEVLVEFTEHLRVRGFAASLADTIEAYRLAVTLAGMRGKHAPGLDEVREATIATMCRGDATHVNGFLWPQVIGKSVGKVGARIGKNSLQEEFWREVKARRLPGSDEPEAFTLKLGDGVQAATSVFLHRLRVADVPYATFRGSAAGVRQGRPGDEAAGGFAALARLREHWEAQWTPSTDVALVERIIYGDTLVQVTERKLAEALSAAQSAAAAAHVLLEAVVAGAPQVMPEALAATERLTAVDDDLLSLARACRALSGLVSYGSSRGGASSEVLLALAGKTFVRAVLRVESAAQGDDEATQPAREAIRILHELAVSQNKLDSQVWFETADRLMRSDAIHPACSGLLAGLLYLAERLSEAEVQDLIGFRLSSLIDPGAGAAFLEGFLAVNALVLVKNREIVAALDRFLQGIDGDRFREGLPVLRRAFATLGATERRYLVENLLAVRQVGGAAAEAQRVIASQDKEQLAAMSDDIAKAMEDLDDLL